MTRQRTRRRLSRRRSTMQFSPSPDHCHSSAACSSLASASFLALLSAAPRMSPSEAPESDEPYCATAAFSSAISSALIETVTLRLLGSIWVTVASTFSPTAKRSGRCSERSRARSARLMKVGHLGAGDLHIEAVLLDGRDFAGDGIALLDAGRSAPSGSPATCLMPSEMRSFSMSTSRTWALTCRPSCSP